ncbi:MAG: hypothetical protein Q7W30_05910 [Coriobacteriia bacterium]|nr:hypothetical protein [Coriobacteriia bacterium]
MNHRTAIPLVALTLAAAIALTGCASPATPTPEKPAAREETAAPAGDAAGMRLAAGLYDQTDGTVLAIGTLEWRDIEGGFWAVIGGSQAGGDAGTVAAVIANAKKDDGAYTALAGKTVEVRGTRIEGASVRMAGPEVNATSITGISDTGGPAD